MRHSPYASQKEKATARRKPACLLRPERRNQADRKAEKEPQSEAVIIGATLRSAGVRVQEQVWTMLPDGSGVCLTSGGTMTAEEMSDLKAEAQRHRAAGFGIKVMP
jgi:hypothetical protein